MTERPPYGWKDLFTDAAIIAVDCWFLPRVFRKVPAFLEIDEMAS